MKRLIVLLVLIPILFNMCHAITEQEYYETFTNFTKLAAEFGGDVPEPPSYEDFCIWYEQNITQHCD